MATRGEGTCIAPECGAVTASVELQLPAVSIMDLPLTACLCGDHFRLVRATAPKVWPRCECGRPKYLDRPGVCAACVHGLGPPIPAPEVAEPAPIRAVSPDVSVPAHRLGRCLALADTCPNAGTLRPGGRYCAEHLPSGPSRVSVRP